MSTVRDKVRDWILEINNNCNDIRHDMNRNCSNCPYDNACTFLLAFDEWRHMFTYRKAGDEDLERLVDAVMSVEYYEEFFWEVDK